jgi:hypothetical protein
MAIKYTYQHLPLPDPPKFTQIGIFGLKINHLATLERTVNIIPLSRRGFFWMPLERNEKEE